MEQWFIDTPGFSPGFRIRPGARIACLGSCFATELAHRASEELFQVTSDSTGVIFDALALHHRFSSIVKAELTGEDDLYEHEGVFHSLKHHGSQCGEDKDELLTELARQDGQLREGVMNADLLIITFGTGSGYFLKESGEVVANCHGLPNQMFERRLLDLATLKLEWIQALTYFFDMNEDAQVVLTVSPIRYTRYGLEENNRGKARLLMLAEYLCEHFEQVHYYPSYEMVIDELRDYRFYNQDMVHPSAEAVDTVYSRFMDAMVSKDDRPLYDRILKWKRFAQHRPQNGVDGHREQVEEMKMELEKELMV